MDFVAVRLAHWQRPVQDKNTRQRTQWDGDGHYGKPEMFRNSPGVSAFTILQVCPKSLKQSGEVLLLMIMLNSFLLSSKNVLYQDLICFDLEACIINLKGIPTPAKAKTTVRFIWSSQSGADLRYG